nr:odorant receptor 35 [Psyttalia incisi]
MQERYASRGNKDIQGSFPVFDQKRSLSRIGFNEMFVVPHTLLRKFSLTAIYADTQHGNGIIFPFISAAMFLCLLCMISNFIHEWNTDMDKALQNVPVLLSAVLAWFGGLLLYATSKKMKRLLGLTKSLWTKQLEENVDVTVIEAAKRSILFNIVYGFFIFTVGTLYLITPFVQIVKEFVTAHDDVQFNLNIRFLPVRYPFAIDTIPTYIMCTIFEVSCVFFFMIAYTSVDTLFLQFTTIGSLLLMSVGQNMKKVTLHVNAGRLDQPLFKKLDHFGKQHSELLLYCQSTEEIFKPIIYLIILFTSANLGICVMALESTDMIK